MKRILRWLLIGAVLVLFTACSKREDVVDDTDTTTKNVVLQKSYSYDSFGRVVQEDLGDGQYMEYVYDDSGNLISQTVVK